MTPIHLLFFIVAVLRFVFLASSVIYWFYYSSFGIRIDFWNLTSKIFYTFSEAAYLFTVFLIANGWRITHSGIQRNVARNALGFLVIFTSVLCFFCYTSTNYYLLSLLVVYIIVFPRIFADLATKSRHLEIQYTAYQAFDDHSPQLIMLLKKAGLLSKTKISTFLYVAVLFLINLIKFIPFINWPLLQQTSEFILWGYMIALVIIFMPKEDSGILYSASDIIPYVREEMNEIIIIPWDLKKTILISWPTQNRTSKLSLGMEEELK